MKRVALVALWLVVGCNGDKDPDPSDTLEASETEAPDVEDVPTVTWPLDDVLRLQHVQLRGTHNSYHLEPELVVHPSHAYSQPPIEDQLGKYGVRVFELDVHKHEDEWLVYHIWLLDQETHCETFRACLEIMATWSQDHRDHLPIIVWVEAKQESGGEVIDDPIALDAEIRAAVPEDILFTPDDLRGDAATVADALTPDGWPTIGALRGRLIVVMLSGDQAEAYLDGAPNLEGRAMFVRPGSDQLAADWAAIAKHLSGDDLALAHERHLLVAENVCGADEDPADCEVELSEKLAAGYHMLKDDFPAPTDGPYVLTFEGDPVARCNPVTAPAECEDEALEGLLP